MNKHLIQNDYENQISRQQAKQLAGYYLQQRIYHGSNPRIIFEHGVHVFNVAKIAEEIAKQTGGTLDCDTAYCLGLLHDIGRIKDETITHVPHGIEGFRYLTDIGYPTIAPICLTHCFINKKVHASDYPTYDAASLAKVKKYLASIEYNDYDRLIQIADMFSRGKEILSIHQRLERNKSFYHMKNISYEESVFALRDYLNEKYNMDIEKIVVNLFTPKIKILQIRHQQHPTFNLAEKFYMNNLSASSFACGSPT